MKKNILKATLVASFALIAGMNVYNAQKSDVMSDLALANVEALAGGESGGVHCCPDPGDSCTLSSGDVLDGQDEC
ncbi:NVEALA domain-containing protein [Phocaeicola sartorii]|uniref:NVEALA domain-containing protein n=1 Tax=Phocaeicola sartorii TaxID=671267 RepID=UPI00242D7263|nr:NVEALA domain-containing protein [Phocaeicola sartorii]